jgi:hypothetical protein
MDKKDRILIHTALIKINGLREKITLEVAELEAMRNGITERQRAKLEMKIAHRKEWVKELNDIELDFRDEL